MSAIQIKHHFTDMWGKADNLTIIFKLKKKNQKQQNYSYHRYILNNH